MYDVTQARPVRHEAARVCVAYTRDQLLSLYTPTRPTAAVTARLRSFNLYTACRLHVQRRRRHRLYDRPVVGCYPCTALEWIRSFLTDRTQQVSYCGRLSPIQCVLFGVPQGSVLGPLLYVLYTAELELIVYTCTPTTARCT